MQRALSVRRIQEAVRDRRRSQPVGHRTIRPVLGNVPEHGLQACVCGEVGPARNRRQFPAIC